MVKAWPFLEGCSCPPTIGDQNVTVWNHLRVIEPTPKTMHNFWCKALKDTICSGNFHDPCIVCSYLFLGGATKIFWKNNPPGPVGSCLGRRKPSGPWVTQRGRGGPPQRKPHLWWPKECNFSDVISAWNPLVSNHLIDGWPSIGWWIKPLHRKWLDFTQHPVFLVGLRFQAVLSHFWWFCDG